MSPDSVESRCNRPPIGWKCTRTAGHDGPCAAIAMTLDDLYEISNRAAMCDYYAEVPVEVAWLRFVRGPGGRKRIVVCDWYEVGAFKVYRRPER
jgi:hypothetical protein